jgi:opacity protein-like surface antigen
VLAGMPEIMAWHLLDMAGNLWLNIIGRENGKRGWTEGDCQKIRFFPSCNKLNNNKKGRFTMKKKISLLAFASVLMFASSAFADNYMTFKAGIYLPEISALDNGINIEAAFGLDLSDAVENLAIEFGTGYYTTSYKWLDIDVIPFTGSGIYTFDFGGPFSLYAGAGLGLYYVSWDAGYADDSELKFGFNLVGGGRLELNDQLDLVFELKHVNVSDDFGGNFLNVGIKYNF